MKKRIELLEEQESLTQVGSLNELVKSWVLAIENKNWDQALKIRNAADPLLSDTEDITRPPLGSPKSAFINWVWFLNYDKKMDRKRFIEAIKSKYSTGYVLTKN